MKKSDPEDQKTKINKHGIKLYWSNSLNRYVSIPSDEKFCACCQGNTISEDPAAAKHDLCDRCYDQFNQRDYDDFIAARKGE